MAGITGLGTTYDLPNYTGILHQLTPSETPFFSAIGGLTGGGQTTSVEFEWETFDLRPAGQNVKKEGQDAPTLEERVRGNVTNICQIHQEAIGVSYTKLAATGAKAGINNEETNPVRDETGWQVEQMLKQMVRDVEWSFLNGRYHKAANNTEERRTRGLRQAVTTNLVNKGASIDAAATLTASTDKVGSTAHGLSNGDKVFLRNVTVGSGLDDTRVYYVVNKATDNFEVALTSGGAKIDILADGTAEVFTVSADDPDPDELGALLQKVYDNGGISEQATATLLVNSQQKVAITKAFANAYGKADPLVNTRDVGGVAVNTIQTDFGVLNVMLDRMVPQHEVIVCSLEQCTPVYQEIPGKGHFFAEPLAKTGASEKVQIYGEVGLGYGSQLAHGVLTGLAAV